MAIKLKYLDFLYAEHFQLKNRIAQMKQVSDFPDDNCSSHVHNSNLTMLEEQLEKCRETIEVYVKTHTAKDDL